MEDLEKRKKALLDKLSSLETQHSVGSEKYFMGQCKKFHLIETKIDKSIHGIGFGGLIKLKYRDREHLAICVGVGLMCEEDSEFSPTKKVIWFLEEECSGILYWRTEKISDVICKNVNVEII